MTAESIRESGPGDLERIVEFDNRFARPGRVQSLALARRFEDANPEPNRLSLIAEASGAVVGTASASDGGALGGGQGRYRANVRVAREHRGHGLGQEMLERVEAHVRAKRAPKLQGAVRGEEPEGVRFAGRNGYAEFHRRFESYADVRAFTAGSFADAATRLERVGLRVERYDVLEGESHDRVSFQRSVYECIRASQQDIPRPDGIPPAPPFEAVRQLYFEGDTFTHDCSALALRGDRCVGASITTVDPTGAAYTIYTGVERAERGQGIALVMKVAILTALQARGASTFGTTNDEANAPMRGINARLGYVVAPPVIEVEKVFEK